MIRLYSDNNAIARAAFRIEKGQARLPALRFQCPTFSSFGFCVRGVNPNSDFRRTLAVALVLNSRGHPASLQQGRMRTLKSDSRAPLNSLHDCAR